MDGYLLGILVTFVVMCITWYVIWRFFLDEDDQLPIWFGFASIMVICLSWIGLFIMFLFFIGVLISSGALDFIGDWLNKPILHGRKRTKENKEEGEGGYD